MQVSVEATSGLGRRLTIDVPADQVDAKVDQRLRDAQKNLRMDGFRPGKVPLTMIKKRYGAAVRNEVLADVMRETYTEAVTQEKLEPAGLPGFEAVNNEAGKDLRYTANIEVFPEVVLADFSGIDVDRQQAEITPADVDEMIDTLRRQRATTQEVGRAAVIGDGVVVDFVGRKGGEEFEGGKAQGQRLELGSGAMIPGFEEGIVGHKKGDEFVLPLTFPVDYQAEELKGQAVEFTITLKAVEEKVLPELDAEFMEAFGVEGGDAEKFRTEVEKNMQRELKSAVENKIKQQVMNGLLKLHDFDLPDALVKGEVGRMRQQMLAQFGGGQKLDPEMLPEDLFVDRAERSVRLGLIVREIVDQHDLKADEAAVRARVEEVASQYEDSVAVTEYLMGNAQQRREVEGAVLEQLVVDKVLESARVRDTKVSYKEAVMPLPEVDDVV
jgi:trigger factor